jgi:hypothetical protein
MGNKANGIKATSQIANNALSGVRQPTTSGSTASEFMEMVKNRNPAPVPPPAPGSTAAEFQGKYGGATGPVKPAAPVAPPPPPPPGSTQAEFTGGNYGKGAPPPKPGFTTPEAQSASSKIQNRPITPPAGTVAPKWLGPAQNAANTAGKILLPLAAVNTTISVATSDNPSKEAGTQAGGWAGGMIGAAAGATLGAKLGATIGSVIPGVGTAGGAFIGGVLGGLFGGYKGAQTGAEMGNTDSSYYDKNKPQSDFDKSAKDQYGGKVADKIVSDNLQKFGSTLLPPSPGNAADTAAIGGTPAGAPAGGDLKTGEAGSGDAKGAGGTPGTKGVLDGLAGGIATKHAKKNSDSLKINKGNQDVNTASTAGDDDLDQAKNEINKGGSVAKGIQDKSTSEIAKGDAENSWGKVIGDALQTGLQAGGAALGTAVGSGLANQTTKAIFDKDKHGDKSGKGDGGSTGAETSGTTSGSSSSGKSSSGSSKSHSSGGQSSPPPPPPPGTNAPATGTNTTGAASGTNTTTTTTATSTPTTTTADTRYKCPVCGSRDTKFIGVYYADGTDMYHCNGCGGTVHTPGGW